MKFCLYFPYNAKLCLSATYAKQQLQRERLQQISDALSAAKIDALLRQVAPASAASLRRCFDKLETGNPFLSRSG
jgi:hypothetical protein